MSKSEAELAANCLRLAVKDKTEFGSNCFILTEHQYNHMLAFMDEYEPKMEAFGKERDDYKRLWEQAAQSALTNMTQAELNLARALKAERIIKDMFAAYA